MLWDDVVVVVWRTGFFAVEVRKSTWELVVAIFRGYSYLTGAVRDVMDRGCDAYFLIKKCQVYLDHFCARSIFERVLDKYTWMKNKPATYILVDIRCTVVPPPYYDPKLVHFFYRSIYSKLLACVDGQSSSVCELPASRQILDTSAILCPHDYAT